ncbi:MAG: hypothetical protein L5656_05415 [Thermanaeromonas sp.]|uniref:hypothetical protein n=1 Tax=Thermanaeromonas sp. TaxID=2003697 RepID=UPI0024395672|nr:hypothetical protein [Thermanaeromonas sp.]MCG0277951.1 hypothetical protein [Thermanaeromonas sp.]
MATNSGVDLEKMRDKLLKIGKKLEHVQVRRSKGEIIDPFNLKLMLLNRSMFGGLHDTVLEFLLWINKFRFCYRELALEFFGKNGLTPSEAEFVLEFLLEAGFLIEYTFVYEKVKIIGMDLAADAAIRAVGERSNFTISTSQEMLRMASLAFVRK